MNNNAWDEISAALTEAHRVDGALTAHAESMGRFLVGKLRRCSHSDLAALKRELAQYNIHTGKWRTPS